MPGSMPATSQLDWLISTTVMIVLSWSRATRDLLKSFGWGIRALHQLATATMVPSPRRLPHTISPLEGDGFEPSVPRQKDNAFRDSSFPTRARATAAFENARQQLLLPVLDPGVGRRALRAGARGRCDRQPGGADRDRHRLGRSPPGSG